MTIDDDGRDAIERLLARQNPAWQAGDAAAFGADVTDDGAVRTRLEQVLVKEDGIWRVAAFHNVAVCPMPMGEPAPQLA